MDAKELTGVDRIEIAGDSARNMGHGLAAYNELPPPNGSGF